MLEHPGAVVILAVDDDERVLVLQQYRHPALIRFVELPAGLLDVEGEDPVVAARRELREEALLLADRWTPPVDDVLLARAVERADLLLPGPGLSPAPDRGGFEPAHEEADMTTAWVPVDDLSRGCGPAGSPTAPPPRRCSATACSSSPETDTHGG